MNMLPIYEVYLKSGRVTTDSRSVSPGSLYFALKGARFDGNDYAMQAIESGAAIAVVDRESLKFNSGCYWVPNVLEALQQLAAYHRKATSVKIVGITGSNGKTTTKELLAAVLSRKFNVWFTQGNLNNHIGVPLTLLAMPPGTELAVIELGANHVGEIAALCQIAQPDMGLITNVGKAHLEGFGSFEGVKTAKGELYDYLKRNRGEVFVNGDNKHLNEMLGDGHYRIYKYGLDSSFEVSASNMKANPFLQFAWKSKESDSYRAETKLTGLYNLENALAAISVGLHFGVGADEIGMALNDYTPVNARSQMVHTGRNTVVLDAYNANPSSMSVALENFSLMDAASKVLVIGGMKELGDESDFEHRSIINHVSEISIDHCYLIGEEFKSITPLGSMFSWHKDVEELLAFFKENPINNTTLLVKGSRSNKLEKIMDVL
jgi:UDP-N-acetylmuramoyl-tripeptide--D-alanyl-D-alanine ligase